MEGWHGNQRFMPDRRKLSSHIMQHFLTLSELNPASLEVRFRLPSTPFKHDICCRTKVNRKYYLTIHFIHPPNIRQQQGQRKW